MKIYKNCTTNENELSLISKGLTHFYCQTQDNMQKNI